MPHVYAFVDHPFSPSGVTHIVKLHKAVGLERELREIAEVMSLMKEGENNVLTVVIAPYGWGKSELLDEIEQMARENGFEVVRTALSLEWEFALAESNKPLVVLIDEADEISRIAMAHKLGALTDEKFMKMIQRVATYIRALLEPKSYRHILKSGKFTKILIIAALTPQLYYTILKNVVPDVFDITTGRVYREIVIDTRFPFWNFVEVVRQRLAAYSPEERRRKIEIGELDSLSPFTLHELAAVYHLARRKGETTPRSLMKYMARLLQIKKSGGGLAHLLREEGIDPDVEDWVLELAFAGTPHEERTYISREVYLYRVPYDDKNAMSVVRDYVAARGRDLDLRDPKNVSYEPYLYYTLVEGGRLYLYLIAEEALDIPAVGRRYVISEEVAKRVLGDEVQNVKALAREYGQKLENPPVLLEEIERALGISGIKLRVCCGHGVWLNNMGMRELYLFFHVDRDDELKRVAAQLAAIVSQGALGEYAVDYVAVFITSRVLLTETIQNAVAPLQTAYWKRYYRESASEFTTVLTYGADKIEKLRHTLVKYAVEKILKRDVETPEFVDVVRLGREKARENVVKYTLALRKGKEKKQMALLKAAEALDEEKEVEGLKAYFAIEEMLQAVEEPIHEKELKSLVKTLFPVFLWRDMREDDLVELMTLRGKLIPRGELLYKFREDMARQHLHDLLAKLHAMSRVVVEKETPLGVLKIEKKLNTSQVNIAFHNQSSYAKILREITRKLLEFEELYEKVKREAEKELEEKYKLAKRVATVVEKLPQRRKFVENINEDIVKREERILQRVEDISKVWGEIRHMALELNDAVDVERDLSLLLELPEPPLDGYLADLKLYAVELGKRYEKHVEAQKVKKTLSEWSRQLGMEEATVEALSAKIGASPRVVWAVARVGRGVLIDVEKLAREIDVPRGEVEDSLEKMYRVGLVEKRYVT